MFLSLLLLALVAPGDSTDVYHGGAGRTVVALPRITAEVLIDGVMDEEVWSRVALLTGFSQYQPIDGRPAEDSTEVRVWYAADAMYFGIRAYARPGTVRATLARRDNIGDDDYIELILDTFNQRRQAYSFRVNPLGVQADGMRAGGGGGGGPDLTQDFQFQSRGRVTDFGYEVEVRIPFKAVRLQPGRVQDWGINVLRKVQYSDQEQTWTAARRAGGPFLTQGGLLRGLTGLERGLVLEINPSVVGKATGAPQPATSEWEYRRSQEAGLTVRWGVTNALTLDATGNPDFSQVEADAGQIPQDERFALSYSEKRPFFLEGIERFNAPNRLIYTRAIGDPDAGLKLTGTVSGAHLGVLSAVDAPLPGRTDRALINVLRLQRNVGRTSFVGLAYTDNVRGGSWNRAGGLDARFDFATMYFVQLQAAGSRSGAAGQPGTGGTLFNAVYDRTGRKWGFNHSIRTVHPDFEARTGFVPRTGYVEASSRNRFTLYPGGVLQTWSGMPGVSFVWDYQGFDAGNPLETDVNFSNNFSFRRGWSASVGPRWSTYRFDPAEYARYRVAGPGGAAEPFQVPGRLTGGLVAEFDFGTAQLNGFSANLGLDLGRDVIFTELAMGGFLSTSASLNWRPSTRARFEASYRFVRRTRLSGGGEFSRQHLPRVKAEYQLTRSLFVRVVSEYNSEIRDAARDWRTGRPLLTQSSSGAVTPVAARQSHVLRTDWLIALQPGPGTVFFLGYGSRMQGPEAFRTRDLDRLNDGFFLKASYLFRS